MIGLRRMAASRYLEQPPVARLLALMIRGLLCRARIQPKRIFIANMQNASTSVMPLAAITGMLPIPMP